jgi:hypothetical protein
MILFFSHPALFHALQAACFTAVTNPVHAPCMVLSEVPQRRKALCAGSPDASGATGGKASHQRRIAAGELWGSVSQKIAWQTCIGEGRSYRHTIARIAYRRAILSHPLTVRNARTLSFAPTSCFAFSREASSLLAQSSIPKIHRGSPADRSLPSHAPSGKAKDYFTFIAACNKKMEFIARMV